jgi:hypothetical protein
MGKRELIFNPPTFEEYHERMRKHEEWLKTPAGIVFAEKKAAKERRRIKSLQDNVIPRQSEKMAGFELYTTKHTAAKNRLDDIQIELEGLLCDHPDLETD